MFAPPIRHLYLHLKLHSDFNKRGIRMVVLELAAASVHCSWHGLLQNTYSLLTYVYRTIPIFAPWQITPQRCSCLKEESHISLFAITKLCDHSYHPAARGLLHLTFCSFKIPLNSV